MFSRPLNLIAMIPAVFVLLWSTGWIVAKYAAPNADPLTFLAVRFACAFWLMGIVTYMAGVEWRLSRKAYGHALLSGILLHTTYLGGVWWAVAHGLPAGISALIAALQPLMTALLAPTLLGEKLKPANKLGILVGFAGVIGVIAPKLGLLKTGGLEALIWPIAINVLGMIGVTLGTFHQKKFIPSGDLRLVSTLQYAGAFFAILPLAWLFEPMRFAMKTETFLALAWSVIPLSLGAVGMMLYMIRRGAVSKVAALIYLIPPTAAVQAYAMFGETLDLYQIAFMALTAFGVYLATRS